MILALELSAGYLLKSRWEACFSIKVYFYIITLFCLAAHNYNGSEADSNCEQMCFLQQVKRTSTRVVNPISKHEFQSRQFANTLESQFPANMDQTSPHLTSTDLYWKPFHLKGMMTMRRSEFFEHKRNKSDRLRLFSIFAHFVFLVFQLLAYWLELQYKWHNQMTLVEKALRVQAATHHLPAKVSPTANDL